MSGLNLSGYPPAKIKCVHSLERISQFKQACVTVQGFSEYWSTTGRRQQGCALNLPIPLFAFCIFEIRLSFARNEVPRDSFVVLVSAMVFSENGRRVRKLTSPCKCHALDHKAWPQKDGNIQVALCMERCPYCAMEFPSCFDLQDHLREATYRARGLKLINTLKTMPAAQAVVSK